MGVHKIIVNNRNKCPLNDLTIKISEGSCLKVDIYSLENVSLLNELKDKGYVMIGSGRPINQQSQ